MDHIVGALRRVISEPDNAASNENQTTGSDSRLSNYLAEEETLQTMDSASRPPAVVEVDEPMATYGVTNHICTDENGTSMSTSSSLSDGNEQQERMHRNYSVDSSVASIRTRSSQNGSGNWGWFEDVHESRAPKKAKNQMGMHQSMPSNRNGEFVVTLCAGIVNCKRRLCHICYRAMPREDQIKLTIAKSMTCLFNY